MPVLPLTLPFLLGEEGEYAKPTLTTPYSYIKEVAEGGISDSSVGLTRRFGGGKTSESVIVSAAGDTVLAVPKTGQRLTLFWISLETSEENASETLVQVKLGAQKPYTWFLGRPGAFMHWEPITGEPGDELVINLSAAVQVAVNFTYSEGT